MIRSPRRHTPGGYCWAAHRDLVLTDLIGCVSGGDGVDSARCPMPMLDGAAKPAAGAARAALLHKLPYLTRGGHMIAMRALELSGDYCTQTHWSCHSRRTGFCHSDGAERTPRSRLVRRPAEQRVCPSFMALFVSPSDRRVAGETDRVCSAQLRVTAMLDSPTVMNCLVVNPRPTGGGGLFRAPPLVFLRYLLNQCRYHHQTCSTLSPNNFTHFVKILKSRVL